MRVYRKSIDSHQMNGLDLKPHLEARTPSPISPAKALKAFPAPGSHGSGHGVKTVWESWDGQRDVEAASVCANTSFPLLFPRISVTSSVEIVRV